MNFCIGNYPADHKMLLFWDHGGGSLSGVAFDENHNYDCLSLGEISDVFYNLSPNGNDTDSDMFKLVGFDACLMATLDVTGTVGGHFASAYYLVASQETEPGNGWNYTVWLNALAENPGMNGALGRFSYKCTESSPGNSETLLSSLDDAVVYKVNGPLRPNSTGLSIFYPYNGSVDDVSKYDVNMSKSMEYAYFTHCLIGDDISEEAADWLNLLEEMSIDLEYGALLMEIFVIWKSQKRKMITIFILFQSI